MSARCLHLYHRTTPESAALILRDRRMVSLESDGSVYFSTRRDGQAVGYGDALVHVAVPAHLAVLDDEFPDGEQHYRINARSLVPSHFVAVVGHERGEHERWE